MSATVSVHVVTYDSRRDLPACLEALSRQSHRRLSVVVVDNASRDGSAELARRLLPSTRVVVNPVNRGFSAAHNQAIRATESDYVLPLNPDVTLDAGYVEALVDALERHPDMGIAAGRVRLPEAGLLDGAGLGLDRRRRQYLRGHGEPDDGRFSHEEEVFGADGSAPLLRRSMLDQVAVAGEWLDEDFVMHKEDVDLCWRARLLGWRAVYTPAAGAVHDRTFRPGRRQAVSQELRRHAVRNRYLMMLKNELAGTFWPHLPWIAGYDLGILGYLLAAERRSLPALADVVRLWPRMREKRRLIQARRRISAAEMRRWLR